MADPNPPIPNPPIPNPATPTVAIIGGGFTGAAVAHHLAREGLRIVVFEPRALLGAGLAYDTDEPVHRINVPAGRMGLHGDPADEFTRFAELRAAKDRDFRESMGQPFPQRACSAPMSPRGWGRILRQAISSIGGRVSRR